VSAFDGADIKDMSMFFLSGVMNSICRRDVVFAFMVSPSLHSSHRTGRASNLRQALPPSG
jgi:hypothetical protein